MINPEHVLSHFSKPVPRYTSYPTAPQFKTGVGEALFTASIAALDPRQPVSAYIHIPYCDRLCWFCGCHTKHTLKYAPVKKYVATLVEEIRLTAAHLPKRLPLGQLHLGGGSPSLLKSLELMELRRALELPFEFSDDTEMSVEIDPSDVLDGTIDGLMAFGLTRASIGVQDFHPDVQTAINRPQSYEITRDVIHALRAAGVKSINIDALYGLPLQTQDRLMDTLAKCVSLHPDRMALFGYAHVPWMKKHQRLIKTEDLPGTVERFEQAQAASDALVQAGYVAIGIDHFAKPNDSLAIAQVTGQLRRNFQGYTTDGYETMIGFGASSIGRFAEGYVQNTVPTHEYQTQIAAGELPKNKGLNFSAEDKLRGELIERLMCDFAVDFAKLTKHPYHLVQTVLKEARSVVDQDSFGMCKLDGTKFEVLPEARQFVRIIASEFDAYYAPEGFQYSKAV